MSSERSRPSPAGSAHQPRASQRCRQLEVQRVQVQVQTQLAFQGSSRQVAARMPKALRFSTSNRARRCNCIEKKVPWRGFGCTLLISSNSKAGYFLFLDGWHSAFVGTLPCFTCVWRTSQLCQSPQHRLSLHILVHNPQPGAAIHSVANVFPFHLDIPSFAANRKQTVLMAVTLLSRVCGTLTCVLTMWSVRVLP